MEFKDIWVEKYRPSTLSDIVLSDSNRQYFENVKKTGILPNLLLVGSPGIGKTSLAKIVINDILKTQYLYINASDENGIDTIRNKVINFAQTQSIFDKTKIIILDEIDNSSMEAQKALRNSMEEYSDITRFILTGNYQHKIIPALQSRCQTFNLGISKKDFIKRILFIIESEKLSIDKDTLTNIINSSYPDLRKCINNLQKYSISGHKINSLQGAESVVEQCLSLLKSKKLYDVRKHIIKSESIFSNDYDMLFKVLFDLLYKNHLSLSDDKNRDCMITVSEYFYRNNIVIDKEINFYTCMIELSRHIL